MTVRPCLGCGHDIESGSRCDDCRLPRRRRAQASATRRGYNHRWAALSRRARAAQPWCSTCLTPGTPKNPLTVDHSPEAWLKFVAGKTLTLKDFGSGLLSVECLKCNVAKGNARGDNVERTD